MNRIANIAGLKPDAGDTRFHHVAEQHAELIPFLWTQRTALVKKRATALSALERFDLRLQANLEGAYLGHGEHAALQDKIWAGDAPAQAFARCFMLIETGDLEHFAHSALKADPRAVVSAIGFVRRRRIAPIIAWLLRHEGPLRVLGARAARAVRLVDAHLLSPLLHDPDYAVRAYALETVGLARALGCWEALGQADPAEPPHCVLLRRWARFMLRPDDAALFEWLLHAPAAYAGLVATAMRQVPTNWREAWVQEYRQNRAKTKQAIMLAGTLGRPEYVSWLIGLTEEPALSAAAAAALYMITGAPALANAGMNDIGASQALINGFSKWTALNKGGFQAGKRYLAGVLVEPGGIAHLLRTGSQHVRRAAAAQAAALWPDHQVINVEAPTYRQLSAIPLAPAYAPWHAGG